MEIDAWKESMQQRIDSFWPEDELFQENRPMRAFNN